MQRPTSPIAVFGVLFLVAGSTARAQTSFGEVEPNGPKAEATPVVCLASGDSLTGSTTGTSITAGNSAPTSADTFRVKTCPLPVGIYKHRLVVTGGTFGTTIRGRNQTSAGAGTTDVAAQTGSASACQWYGFGHEEEIYYRVTGSASTTSPYTSTLTTTTVVPTSIGPFAPGTITITTQGQGHTTDTELWVYDGNLHAIPTYGNDDATPAAGLQSKLTRTYAAGTYYLAISTYNMANDQVAASDDNFDLGSLLDFPDAITDSVTTANQVVNFAVTDANGTTQYPATKPGAFDVVWFRFVVGSSGISSLCAGDGTSATPCPCGNTGAPGRGCNNSQSTGGALLTASGGQSPDTIVLTSSGELASVLSIFLQGNALVSPPVPFGDGIRCTGGAIKRLYVKNASGGVVSAPTGANPSITQQSAALGDPIAPGSTRWYQVYYRDPDLAFCPFPTGNSWNASGAIEILW